MKTFGERVLQASRGVPMPEVVVVLAGIIIAASQCVRGDDLDAGVDYLHDLIDRTAARIRREDAANDDRSTG